VVSRTWKIVLILSLVANISIIYVAIKALEYRSHINEFRDKYRAVISEFSGRDVYYEDNLRLRSDTTISCRVVFLGTQVTKNWDLSASFPGYETINRGIEGQRIVGFLLRFRSDVVNLHPQAVVIEISSYHFRPASSLEEIGEYVASLADLARANNIVPIFTTVIPPADEVGIDDYPDYQLHDSVVAFNGRLKDYCAANNLALADIAAAVTTDRGYLNGEYAISPVDLNAEGYARISEAVRQSLDTLTNCGK